MSYKKSRLSVPVTIAITGLFLLALFFLSSSLIGTVVETINSFKDKGWFKVLDHILTAVVGAIAFHFIIWRWNLASNRILVEDTAKHLNELVAEASSIGLTKIYPSRCKAGTDLYAALETAKKRIWLSGIGMSEVFKLTEKADLLQSKLRDNVDVRIILLNPLSKEAVSRTLLESSQSVAEIIVGTTRQCKRDVMDNDPFFSQQVFCDSSKNVRVLDRYNDEMKLRARFYSHTPDAWMLIVDDVIYYQSYTNGCPEGIDPKSLGPLMPVFRYDATTNSPNVQTMESHFEQEWTNAQADLFHMVGILEDKKKLLQINFNENGCDFKNMVGAQRIIRKPGGHDRRKRVRRSCQIPKLEFTVEWMPHHERNNGKAIASILKSSEAVMAKAKVVDFSSCSIALQLEQPKQEVAGAKIRWLPVRNQTVTLRVDEEPNSNAFRWFNKQLLQPTKGVMKVIYIRKRNNDTIIVLKPLEALTMRRILKEASSYLSF
ncbi:MAG: hypothetical protein V7641_4682 [Blastocatellia bacterium]